MTEKSVQRKISEQGSDGARLEYRQVGDRAAESALSRRIDSLWLEEVLDLTGADREERRLLSRRCRTAWFANGYQSWSPGWELSLAARHPRIKLKKILSMYSGDESPMPRGLKLPGHGFAYVRGGETYVALVSLAGGAQGVSYGAPFAAAGIPAAAPPVTFVIDRVRARISVDISCRGASFRDGELLAEIALVRKTGPFAFANAIRELFKDRTCMDRAGFLAPRGSSHIGGWVSWYSHYTSIDERIIREDLEGLASSGNLIRRCFTERGRPVVFQVDDGWETDIGDWMPEPRRFPSGMKVLAEAIAAHGFIPGLWLAPFLVRPTSALFRDHPEWLLRWADGSPPRARVDLAPLTLKEAPRLAGWNPNWGGGFFCLDLSRADVRDYLRSLFEVVIEEWGFRYIKLDFLYAGLLSDRHSREGGAWRWYHEALRPIVARTENAAGEPVAFLGCGAPLESSVGLFPLMRVGADTSETWDMWLPKAIGHIARPSAYVNLKSTLGRWFMNRALYLSDPDVVFMRSTHCTLTESQKELIAACALMFSSQIMISDDVGRFGAPGEAERTERAMRLFDALSGRRYCAVSAARDVWRCFSEDGVVRGIVNLRSRPVYIDGRRAATWRLHGEQVTMRSETLGKGLIIEPGSIALWRGEPSSVACPIPQPTPAPRRG